MSAKPAPDNRQLAQMQVLTNLGLTAHAISKRMKLSNHTVSKYLASEKMQSKEVQALIELITQKEVDDLTILGAKARNRLHELMDEGKSKMIETCAVMDRSFQIVRLLTDQTTENIGVGIAEIKADNADSKLIEVLNSKLKESTERKKEGALQCQEPVTA